MLIIPCHRQIQIPAPIFWINSLFNIPMKTGIRPVYNSGDQAMFYRINMHIIHMVFEVGIKCSQKCRCHIPRSLAAFRTFDRYSVFGNAPENPLLINRQRLLKSASSDGNVQTACICSGKTTQASILNGYRSLTARTVSRKKSTSRISKSLFLRSSKFTVKNHVPPGINMRR